MYVTKLTEINNDKLCKILKSVILQLYTKGKSRNDSYKGFITNSNPTVMDKSVLLALCAMMAGQMSEARQLSPEEAWNNAMNVTKTETPQDFTMMRTMSEATQTPTLSYTVETNEEPTVYVFTGSTGGYWVVAANDAVPHSLLGYTDTGIFDADNIPENVDWLLNQYGQQIAYAASMEETYATVDVEKNEHECSGDRHCISPILTTKWGQLSPFNKYCPLYDGKSTPTGCVATGMAQVMFHYRYPEAGIGSVSYTSNKTVGKISYDFASNPFDWNAMENASVRPVTEESADAVAALMYACGVSVKMNYKPSGSSSSCITAARALVSTFGYDKGAACLSRDYFDLDKWIEILYEEIEAGRPVLYSGTSETDGGHFFILDGYECGNYFHVNWGWDGGFNGYFIVTALDHRRQSKGFSYRENIIVGVQPAKEASEIRPVVLFNGDMSMTKTECLRYNYYTIPIRCSNGIFNQSVGKLTNVKLGVKLVDEEGNVKYTEGPRTYNLLAGQAIVSYDMRGDAFPESGRWIVYPAVKTESGVWHDILVNREGEYAYVVECEGRDLRFMPMSEVIAAESVKDIHVTHLSVNNDIIPGEAIEIEAGFNNTSNTNYTKYLTPTLMSEGSSVAAGTMLTIELHSHAEDDVHWTSFWTEDLAAGNYRLALIDRKGNTIGEAIEVKVVRDYSVSAVTSPGDDAAREIRKTEVYTIDGIAVAEYDGREATDLIPGIYLVRYIYDDGTAKIEKKLIR